MPGDGAVEPPVAVDVETGDAEAGPLGAPRRSPCTGVLREGDHFVALRRGDARKRTGERLRLASPVSAQRAPPPVSRGAVWSSGGSGHPLFWRATEPGSPLLVPHRADRHGNPHDRRCHDVVLHGRLGCGGTSVARPCAGFGGPVRVAAREPHERQFWAPGIERWSSEEAPVENAQRRFRPPLGLGALRAPSEPGTRFPAHRGAHARPGPGVPRTPGGRRACAPTPRTEPGGWCAIGSRVDRGTSPK
jgi:hypothetical protein